MIILAQDSNYFVKTYSDISEAALEVIQPGEIPWQIEQEIARAYYSGRSYRGYTYTFLT